MIKEVLYSVKVTPTHSQILRIIQTKAKYYGFIYTTSNKKDMNDKENKKPEDLSNDRMGNLNDDNEQLANNLHYEDDKDSFDLDVDSDTKDYIHPSGYDTAAEGGEDMDSDWDEANLYVGDEYDDRKESIENELDESDLHIRDKNALKTNLLDKKLSQTPEDEREDLDEEGYPKNDGESMP